MKRTSGWVPALLAAIVVFVAHDALRGHDRSLEERALRKQRDDMRQLLSESRAASAAGDSWTQAIAGLERDLRELESRLPPSLDAEFEAQRIERLAEQLGWSRPVLDMGPPTVLDFYSTLEARFTLESPNMEEVKSWISGLESQAPLRRVTAIELRLEHGEWADADLTLSSFFFGGES